MPPNCDYTTAVRLSHSCIKPCEFVVRSVCPLRLEREIIMLLTSAKLHPWVQVGSGLCGDFRPHLGVGSIRKISNLQT